MKWLICILICWCSIGNTTAQHYSFNRYADIDGITRVYISKTLLKAIIKSENPAMKISGNKVNLNNKELLSKMDGILVLTGTNTRIANMMHEDATNSVIQKNMNIYYTAMRKNWPLTSSHVNRKE